MSSPTGNKDKSPAKEQVAEPAKEKNNEVENKQEEQSPEVEQRDPNVELSNEYDQCIDPDYYEDGIDADYYEGEEEKEGPYMTREQKLARLAWFDNQQPCDKRLTEVYKNTTIAKP